MINIETGTPILREFLRVIWRMLPLVLACDYFAFRTELFSEEFEKNYCGVDTFPHQVVLSPQSLTWESFDKDNAPKAFTINPPDKIILIESLPTPSAVLRDSIDPYELIRDKSPPRFASHYPL